MHANELTATEACRLIAARKLSCVELVQDCNARIAAREPQVRAWLHHDPTSAVEEARRADASAATVPLRGLPIGVKDVIETADQPTTYNSDIYRGHRPAADAECVAVLRANGAFVMGKTDTVEFACAGRKARTANPRDLLRTPGGSSSGSAAAVADHMVPLALGTQTGGSHIRPAAYTGIYACKPSWGLVNRAGVRMYSPSLDTVGWYARSAEDLKLAASAFRIAPPQKTGDKRGERVAGLRIGVCRTPFHVAAEPDMMDALIEAGRRLADGGARVEELELPLPFHSLDEIHATIMFGEGRSAFLSEYLVFGDRLHRDFRDHAENSRAISSDALLAAYRHAERCRILLDDILTRFDAILAPAAPGEAPVGLEFTGSIIFNAFWTLMHVPCIAIPAGTGRMGMPLGLQLIGQRLADASLFDLAISLAPIIHQQPFQNSRARQSATASSHRA